MPNENEGVETTTEEVEPKAPSEEVETDVQSASTERDYRKELEEEQAKRALVEKERDNYRTATLITKRKLRKKEVEPVDDEDILEEEFENQTENQADVIADRVLQKIAPAISQNVVEQEIANYTQNPDKSSFIKFHYDNSIVKTGMDTASIRADVQKAIAIADAPKLRIERDEVARVALASRTPALSSSGRGGESEIKTTPYGWTPEQIKAINQSHNLAIGRNMTDQELTNAWNLYKSGSATAELSQVK